LVISRRDHYSRDNEKGTIDEKTKDLDILVRLRIEAIEKNEEKSRRPHLSERAERRRGQQQQQQQSLIS
jgi:hypothetical protein